MISLEQIRLLESRVEKAVVYIDLLQDENASLKEKLTGYEKRIQDLEVLIRGFHQDQGRIEEGILHALDRLNAFEDAILSDAEERETQPITFQPATKADDEPQDDAPSQEQAVTPAPAEEPAPADGTESDEPQTGGELDIF